MLQIRRVKVPLIAIAGAIPRAVRRAQATAADDRAPESPGGEKVTAGEVAECILVFALALAEEVTEPFLRANGLG